MPYEQYQNQLRVIWENNADTPLTAAALSKSADVITYHKDFTAPLVGDAYNKENSFIVKGGIGDNSYNPTARDTLIVKRFTRFAIINRAEYNPGSDPASYIIPINDHYRIFDVGLDDLYLTVWDIDDNPSNEQDPEEVSASWWGQNNEWFIYVCDMNDSEYDSGPEINLGGAEFLLSTRRDYPEGEVAGDPGRF